jgi:hypothetical protein
MDDIACSECKSNIFQMMEQKNSLLWHQIGMNVYCTSFSKRNILEKMREAARKKKERRLTHAGLRADVVPCGHAFHSHRQEEAMAHYSKSCGHL